MTTVEVIGPCPTGMDFESDHARFTVRCSLDAGHAGPHRGRAEIVFVGLDLEPAR